jgi:eukaryotic-like serine/threonine-protein kinase
MGVVYEALNLRSNRTVALKLLATNVGEEMPDVNARFEREVRATSSLDSDNIVRVYDAGTDEESGAPYMVMELVRGHDLHQWFRRVKLMRPDAVVRIAAQIAVGLGKAHAAGVIHRDIKPGNIFIAEQGGEMVPKILDFGIAKLKMEQVQGDTGLTKTGNMLGSPHYMSPEQAQGLRSIDHRTDIWSLGILMYKALTGRTPFADLDGMGQVIIAIWSMPIPPLQDAAPWVSPELAALVHRALEKKPDNRFQTADEVQAALRALTVDGSLTLTPEMFTPLPDESRNVVAPKLELTGDNDPLLLGEGPASRVADLTVGSLSAAADRTQGVRRRSPRVVLGFAAGALAVIAVAGGVGIGLSQAGRAPAVDALAATASAPAPPSAVSREVVAEASAAAPASASPPEEKRVRFGVPQRAVVFVDGVPAVAADGGVELSGLPGLSKLVVVRVGAREAVQHVIITAQGADPAELPLSALRDRRASAPAAAKKGPEAGDPPPARPPPANTAIDRRFE